MINEVFAVKTQWEDEYTKKTFEKIRVFLTKKEAKLYVENRKEIDEEMGMTYKRHILVNADMYLD
jgi:hypothetical protein